MQVRSRRWKKTRNATIDGFDVPPTAIKRQVTRTGDIDTTNPSSDVDLSSTIDDR